MTFTGTTKGFWPSVLTRLLLPICIVLGCVELQAQVRVNGVVKDGITGETLPFANVILKGTTVGIQTDYDGKFDLSVPENPPFTIVISYVGYKDYEHLVEDASEKIKVEMESAAFSVEAVEIKASRLTEKTKEAPQTIESMDIIAIKETAAASFYDGLGTLKGVDQTSASLGFTIINTRGFNSTSPVRSLQTIDGVDNQAPGLNFSLGNFLGASELDVQKVDLVVGANGAYYGPNAFNGVIAMSTKDPFLHQGFSIQTKIGERAMFQGAARYAKAFKNKDGKEKFAFKLNLHYLRANDWEADNYDEVYQEDEANYVGVTNPGGYDAVNIYGDESFSSLFDATTPNDFFSRPGLGRFFRNGYEEKDIVNYDTRNIKAAIAVHYKIRPKLELIGGLNYGTGTTVYQGDNRFSLDGLKFWQSKIELRQKDKFFIRAYRTQEDDGNTYDAYFTALKLLERQKTDTDYAREYAGLWTSTQATALGWPYHFVNRLKDDLGYPTGATWNLENAEAFLLDPVIQDSLTLWHQLVEDGVNSNEFAQFGSTGLPRLEPGTPEFDAALEEITGKTVFEGGSGFYDKSALNHIHGEYTFNPSFTDNIIVGANYRQYQPDSRRTIFDERATFDTTTVAGEIVIDTSYSVIRNSEFGVYAGFEKRVMDGRLKINGTVRADKNENFDLLWSPALSAVYTINSDNILRISGSSAIRNPTLTDQYLRYNVGRALLVGNITGYYDLITIDSFNDWRTSLDTDDFNFLSIDPVQPEKVNSIEVGYRTTLFKRLYLDGSYYFSSYKDFIGYNIGIDVTINDFGFLQSAQVYRVSANAAESVTTQGFSIGANYYFARYFAFAGNYSWNKLNTQTDDPIVPAFNTPEHKFNLGINGRNIEANIGSFAIRNVGFNVNYKWIQGFIFEGSPQFTGPIDTYGLLDAQINYTAPKIGATFKIGASNLLNNKVYQVYGGPRVGRLAYFSVTYEIK